MGKRGAGISEPEGNMQIISYIFNVLEVACNRGIRSTPLGDAILPCNVATPRTQPELECIFGALGEIGQGRLFGAPSKAWCFLPGASPGRVRDQDDLL